MLTFEQALELTDKVGGRAAYEIEALRGLWVALSLLEPMSTIVEVGCEYGRSTSLIAQVAKEDGHDLILIDPFVGADPTGQHMSDRKAYDSLLDVLWQVGYPFTLHTHRTIGVASLWLPASIGLVHIDGDHRRAALTQDCYTLLPRVHHGGVAVFHDYSRHSLLDVKAVVDEFTQGWEVIGTWHTCHVLRKPV